MKVIGSALIWGVTLVAAFYGLQYELISDFSAVLLVCIGWLLAGGSL